MKVLNENLSEGKDDLTPTNNQPYLSSSQNDSNGWLYIFNILIVNFVNLNILLFFYFICFRNQSNC